METRKSQLISYKQKQLQSEASLWLLFESCSASLQGRIHNKAPNAQQSKCRPPSFDFILGFRKKLAALWGKALRAFARQLFDRCCRSFSAGKSNQALLTLVGSQMKIEKWCITTILRWQFLLEAWSYMKGPSKLDALISRKQFSGLRHGRLYRWTENSFPFF